MINPILWPWIEEQKKGKNGQEATLFLLYLHLYIFCTQYVSVNIRVHKRKRPEIKCISSVMGHSTETVYKNMKHVISSGSKETRYDQRDNFTISYSAPQITKFRDKKRAFTCNYMKY